MFRLADTALRPHFWTQVLHQDSPGGSYSIPMAAPDKHLVSQYRTPQGEGEGLPEGDKAIPLGLASVMVPHDPSINTAKWQKGAEQKLIIDITA